MPDRPDICAVFEAYLKLIDIALICTFWLYTFWFIIWSVLQCFIRICLILIGRIIQSNLIDKAHQKLVEIVKIIKQNYGQDKLGSLPEKWPSKNFFN